MPRELSHLQHPGHEAAVITAPYSILAGSPCIDWDALKEDRPVTITVELLCKEGHKEWIKRDAAGRLIVRGWLQDIVNASILEAKFICTRVSETAQCGELCRIHLVYESITKDYDAESS